MLRPNGEECNHGAMPILAWTHSGRLAWFPKPPRRLLRKACFRGRRRQIRVEPRAASLTDFKIYRQHL